VKVYISPKNLNRAVTVTTPPPMAVSVCKHIFGTTGTNFANVFGKLAYLAVVPSSPGGAAIRRALPVLWVTSCWST